MMKSKQAIAVIIANNAADSVTTRLVVSLAGSMSLLAELFGSHLREAATKTDLSQLKDKIMSVISDYAAAMSTHLDAIGTAIDGVATDVKTLNDLIAQLQGAQLSTADKTLLDNLKTRGAATAAKLKALDDLTPPPAPAPTI